MKKENKPITVIKDEKSIQKEKKPIDKARVRKWIINYSLIIFASIIRGMAVHSFTVPNNFTPGGVTGIATMLQHVTNINSGMFILVINIPLVILAAIFINKKFAIKTGVSTLIISGTLYILEIVKFPQFVSSNLLLPAIAGGVIGGTGLAILLKNGASSGGTDVIASFLQKYRAGAASIPKLIFALDSIVVLSSIFVYKNADNSFSLEPALLSMVLMFCSSKAGDAILEGLKSAIKFEIITSSPKEIADEIMAKLGRGVTQVAATGMYSGEERSLLFCVISKQQINRLQKIIKKHPDSFAYITPASEVIGKGFGERKDFS